MNIQVSYEAVLKRYQERIAELMHMVIVYECEMAEMKDQLEKLTVTVPAPTNGGSASKSSAKTPSVPSSSPAESPQS